MVDDEKPLAQMVATYLARAGYAVDPKSDAGIYWTALFGGQ